MSTQVPCTRLPPDTKPDSAIYIKTHGSRHVGDVVQFVQFTENGLVVCLSPKFNAVILDWSQIAECHQVT